MTMPWTLRSQVDELSHKWNVLHAQVVGPSVPGRQGIAKAAQAKVIAGRAAFRNWVKRIMARPLVEALGTYEEQYAHYNNVYGQIRDEAMRALPSGERVQAAPPTQPTTDWASFVPFVLGIAAISAVANLIGVFKGNK